MFSLVVAQKTPADDPKGSHGSPAGGAGPRRGGAGPSAGAAQRVQGGGQVEGGALSLGGAAAGRCRGLPESWGVAQKIYSIDIEKHGK